MGLHCHSVQLLSTPCAEGELVGLADGASKEETTKKKTTKKPTKKPTKKTLRAAVVDCFCDAQKDDRTLTQCDSAHRGWADIADTDWSCLAGENAMLLGNFAHKAIDGVVSNSKLDSVANRELMSCVCVLDPAGVKISVPPELLAAPIPSYRSQKPRFKMFSVWVGTTEKNSEGAWEKWGSLTGYKIKDCFQEKYDSCCAGEQELLTAPAAAARWLL